MNPYKILDIGNNPANAEIIQAAARALRERRFSGKEIAMAQKTLLDPISRKVHEFVQFIDVKPILEKLNVTRSEVRHVSSLKYLTVFDADE